MTPPTMAPVLVVLASSDEDDVVGCVADKVEEVAEAEVDGVCVDDLLSVSVGVEDVYVVVGVIS